MEREYSDEKVIISRKRLEELEQQSNTLKLQLEEERKKFKESATYCIIRKHNFNIGYYTTFEDVYCNSDVIKELSDKIEKKEKEYKTIMEEYDTFKSSNWNVIKELSNKIEQQEKAFEGLMKYSKALESFYKLPFYKRIFHKTIKLK